MPLAPRSDPTEPILAGLNPAQREAVMHGTGPQLVVAGAGTGKTAVITRRIARLVADKQCTPREILALTFTEKAAEEMESRVDLLVPYGFTDSTICTFHAFGDRVLREKGLLLGLNPAYTILSAAEQLVFLRQHLFEFPLQALRPLSDPTRHLQLLAGIISRAQDEDVDPEAYLAFCQARLDQSSSGDPADKAAWSKQAEVARVYQLYQQRLLEQGLLDFGSLIRLTLELFRRHPDALADYKQRYRYILVDEFQDTNAAQFELVQLLAGANGNLTVVGDDDQSIYKFRGAAISNILQFTRHYPQARLTVLTENYRSTQTILDAAYRLIQHNNPERLETRQGISKKLKSVREAGQPVRFEGFATVSDEADWVAGEIRRQKDALGRPWSDFAVLVRTNRQADPFLRACNVKEIPVRFSGARGFYRRPEIRLCTAFLRTLADPSAPLPMYELCASEVYELPAEDLAGLAAHSRRQHLPLRNAMRLALAGQIPLELSPAGREAVERLLRDLTTYLEMSRRSSAGQVLYHFLNAAGLLAKYTAANTLAADGIIRNWAKLFKLIQRFQEISRQERILPLVEQLDLLDEVADEAGSEEMEAEADAVRVLTVHRAKGLEFPVVFLAGMAANRFPAVNRQAALSFPPELAKEEPPPDDQTLAEERRLCYVAITRAAETLYLTAANDYGGSRRYKVSRFVMEALDMPEMIEKQTQTSAMEQIRRAQDPMGTEPVPLTLENRALSLSFYQVDDYLTCPLKYKYIHLLEIPVLPQHAVVYGKALHTAVTAYHRAQLEGVELGEKELVDIFMGAWVNAGFISREHEEMRQKAGINAIKLFINNTNINLSKPIYIEKSFSYNINDIKIIGRMDRVDLLAPGKARIIDYKSSETSEQEDADKKAKESLQLKIYAQAWYHEQGYWPESVHLHFLDSGLTGSWVVDPAKVEKDTAVILAVAQGIREKKFRATPSVWVCNYCPYRAICPEAIK
ncbi:MAG: ATP-dependent DNA helicase [candidate division FCPU426 bacterium]